MATPIQKTATAGEYVLLRDTNNDIVLMQSLTVPTDSTTSQSLIVISLFKIIFSAFQSGTINLFQNLLVILVNHIFKNS